MAETARAALDGIYVLRTSVAENGLDPPDIVRAYKQLTEVEKDFRALKGPDLEIRPIHHRLERRVRAHVLLCMLALYVERQLHEAWRALTFTDEHPPERPDPVPKATRSPAAAAKAQTKRTTAGDHAHSFRSLLAELATQTHNTIRVPGSDATFTKLAHPTALQADASVRSAEPHAPAPDDRQSWRTTTSALSQSLPGSEREPIVGRRAPNSSNAGASASSVPSFD